MPYSIWYFENNWMDLPNVRDGISQYGFGEQACKTRFKKYSQHCNPLFIFM
jgi:hypothetical protein